METALYIVFMILFTIMLVLFLWNPRVSIVEIVLYVTFAIVLVLLLSW